MTSDDAIKWVDANKGLIVSMAKEYVEYVPYGVDDYIQDAYSAAIEAAITCQRNPSLKFAGVFTMVFRRHVARVTPFPDDARVEYKKKKAEKEFEKENLRLIKAGLPPIEKPVEEDDSKKDKDKKYHSGGTSSSYVSTARSDVRLDILPDRKRHRGIDIEKVFEQKVRPVISEKEAHCMELALGLTKDGVLSDAEIAERFGISRRTVRTHLERAYTKVGQKSNLLNMEEAKKRLRGDTAADVPVDILVTGTLGDGEVSGVVGYDVVR